MSSEEDFEDRHLKDMGNMIQLSLNEATASSAPLSHLVPNYVGHKALGDDHEDEIKSSAKTRA